MTCAFDRDLIALYAGGDGPTGAAEIVEEHLTACAACRALLAEYKQGMGLVLAHRSQAQYPHAAAPVRRGLHTAWRLAGATLIALVALGAIGVYTESPAMAALLKTLGLVQVREMNTEEAKQYQAEQQAWWDSFPRDLTYDANGVARDASGRVIAAQSTRVTFEEAERAVDYHLLKPRYLPEGFAPSFASLFLNDFQSDVTLGYGNGKLIISQTAPGKQIHQLFDVPAGASESVLVAGEPAVLVRGTWGVGPDNRYEWTPGSPVTLTFTRDQQVIRIVAGQVGYPAEELIKIAESLE
ncbi:MAG TPA: hypothetical protein VD973_27435 [Symbiobacteriaceae bacterium]|nr:hypothetical protein [Symbiobacteriaceae bacterium]